MLLVTLHYIQPSAYFPALESYRPVFWIASLTWVTSLYQLVLGRARAMSSAYLVAAGLVLCVAASQFAHGIVKVMLVPSSLGWQVHLWRILRILPRSTLSLVISRKVGTEK